MLAVPLVVWHMIGLDFIWIMTSGVDGRQPSTLYGLLSIWWRLHSSVTSRNSRTELKASFLGSSSDVTDARPRDVAKRGKIWRRGSRSGHLAWGEPHELSVGDPRPVQRDRVRPVAGKTLCEVTLVASLVGFLQLTHELESSVKTNAARGGGGTFLLVAGAGYQLCRTAPVEATFVL